MAKIKADVRSKRTERDKQEQLKQIERERRKFAIESLFNKWYLPDHGRLEMTIVTTFFIIKNLIYLMKPNLIYISS